MQHGGLWVSLGLMPSNNKAATRDSINYVGGYGGLLTTSPTDASPAEMSKGDLDTARAFGERVAAVATIAAPDPATCAATENAFRMTADRNCCSTRTTRTWAAASRCGACCRPRSAARSGPSSSSTTSARPPSSPAAQHDVRPHPHIGLATVTYLFEGAMMHRDSLGSVQEILPGAINWMTAGRGIVHSERKPERLLGRDLRQPRPAAVGRAAAGLRGGRAELRAHRRGGHSRSWMEQGVPVRVLIGEAFGVTLAGEDLCADALPRHRAAGRRALRAAGAGAGAGGLRRSMATSRSTATPVPAHTMAVLPDRQGAALTRAGARCALVVIGGDAARRPALHHLELRLQPARAHPRGRRRLGGAAHGPGARRDRIHPAAGASVRQREAGRQDHAGLASYPSARGL